MSTPSAFRFFGVMLRPRTSIVALVALIVAVALWMGRNDPRDLDQTIVLALLVQMFSAASGYREPARRGHFDALLVSGHSRSTIALAHWALSIAPGAALWVSLTGIAAAFRPAEWPLTLSAASLAALLFVSCAAWALALPLTRHSTGVIWLATLFVLAGTGHVQTLRSAYLGGGGGWGSALRATAAVLVCPLFLLTDASAGNHLVLSLVIVAAVLCVASGAAYIAALDIPLADPS